MRARVESPLGEEMQVNFGLSALAAAEHRLLTFGTIAILDLSDEPDFWILSLRPTDCQRLPLTLRRRCWTLSSQRSALAKACDYHHTS